MRIEDREKTRAITGRENIWIFGKRGFMPNKKTPKRPVENHKTAAWSNTEQTNAIARSSHPSLLQALNAKEYVDDNEK
jgi:hypothetical protein